jgi:hypothetical protein
MGHTVWIATVIESFLTILVLNDDVSLGESTGSPPASPDDSCIRAGEYPYPK